MPSTSVRLKPGVNTVATPALNEAGIASSNMIRFRSGLVEKRGGWSSFFANAAASAIRALCAFQDQFSVKYLAAGAVNGLALVFSGQALDIAPRAGTTTPTAPFSTTSGSGVVTVNDPGFSPLGSDYVVVAIPTSVGGLILYGGYSIASIVDSAHYTIATGLSASSTVNNGGAVPTFSTTSGSASVKVSLANFNPVVGGPFAIVPATTVGGVTLLGNYTVATVIDANTFTITAQTVATATATAPFGNSTATELDYSCFTPKGKTTTAAPLQTLDWSLGGYGSVLLAMAPQRGLYSWSATSAFRYATMVQAAPTGAGVIVADAQQMAVVYGCLTPGTLIKNAIAWSDAGGFTTWKASGTNQAGSYTLPTGSGIIGAAVGPNQILVWTDIDVWSMTYIGYPFVWSFQKIATGCGLAAQFAWVRIGSAVLWMSQKQFWIFDGGAARALPCTVWDDVFPMISAANAWKIRGGANSGFDEALWFFPSISGAGENDTYVCYNPVEGTWDTGSMARSAWTDQSLIGQPIGGDPSGNLFQHEVSPDAAGTAIQASFTTGWFLVEEGEVFSFVDWVRPDIKFPTGAGTVQVSILTAAYTTDTPTIAGPFPITAATEFINTRCRGRYVALRFASSDIGSFWRLGRVQMRFAPSGRR